MAGSLNEVPPGPSTAGWVYILTNPALQGMVKIGMTSKEPWAAGGPS